MKEYEDTHYERWMEHVEAILPGLMKHTVLVKMDPTSHHPPGAASGIAVNKERRASAELMPHMSSMSKLFA